MRRPWTDATGIAGEHQGDLHQSGADDGAGSQRFPLVFLDREIIDAVGRRRISPLSANSQFSLRKSETRGRSRRAILRQDEPDAVFRERTELLDQPVVEFFRPFPRGERKISVRPRMNSDYASDARSDRPARG
jgi:hypothetical protein